MESRRQKKTKTRCSNQRLHTRSPRVRPLLHETFTYRPPLGYYILTYGRIRRKRRVVASPAITFDTVPDLQTSPSSHTRGHTTRKRRTWAAGLQERAPACTARRPAAAATFAAPYDADGPESEQPSARPLPQYPALGGDGWRGRRRYAAVMPSAGALFSASLLVLSSGSLLALSPPSPTILVPPSTVPSLSASPSYPCNSHRCPVPQESLSPSFRCCGSPRSLAFWPCWPSRYVLFAVAFSPPLSAMPPLPSCRYNPPHMCGSLPRWAPLSSAPASPRSLHTHAVVLVPRPHPRSPAHREH